MSTIEFYETLEDGSTHEVDPKFFRFPGGEWQLAESVVDQTMKTTEVSVLVRGSSLEDLMKAGLWNSFWAGSVEHSTLYIPYLPAARSDKGKTAASPLYNAIITSLGFDSVVVLDPHSDEALEGLNWGLQTYGATALTLTGLAMAGKLDFYQGVVSPDGGARVRASAVAKALGVPVYVGRKTRNQETGEIEGLVFDDVPGFTKNLLVVDDICDGGATFAAVAEGLYMHNLGLWVTHGIFSKGTGELQALYDMIYTTDSFRGDREKGIMEVPITPFLRMVSKENR